MFVHNFNVLTLLYQECIAGMQSHEECQQYIDVLRAISRKSGNRSIFHHKGERETVRFALAEVAQDVVAFLQLTLVVGQLACRVVEFGFHFQKSLL